jgi:hypothetical protein
MNPWQLMFLQSKVNDKPYFGDSLATQNWVWPQDTWFQKRLRRLRVKQWHAHAIWDQEGVDRSEEMRRPEASSARFAPEDETRYEEDSYDSYARADAPGGREHFS